MTTRCTYLKQNQLYPLVVKRWQELNNSTEKPSADELNRFLYRQTNYWFGKQFFIDMPRRNYAFYPDRAEIFASFLQIDVALIAISPTKSGGRKKKKPVEKVNQPPLSVTKLFL